MQYDRPRLFSEQVRKTYGEHLYFAWLYCFRPPPPGQGRFLPWKIRGPQCSRTENIIDPNCFPKDSESQGRNDREQKTSSTQILSQRIRKPIGEQLIPSAIPENLRPAMIINSKSSSTDTVPRKVSEDFRGTPSLPLALLLPPAAAHRKVALFHGDFRARNENKTNSIVHRSFS